MTISKRPADLLPSAEWAAVQEVVARFEAAWRRAERPAVADYWRAGDGLPLLIELAHTELEYRLKAGEPVGAEDYVRRFPELAADPRHVVQLATAEYRLRRRREPNLTPDEFLGRWPQHRDLLARELTPTVTSLMAPPRPRADGGGEDAAPAPPPPAGYEILGELGRGGMGVVFRARQSNLDRVVALKMILDAGYAGADELARFRAEAGALARLQHPNIVQVHEVGEHEGRPFFSMEFCPGGGLDRKLQGAPLPPAEAARLAETLARALHAAHRQHVIHRDLKPANVLLGADGAPKIADFGLAKKLDADRSVSQTGQVMGTPSYMPPEQARGLTREAGPASDVYGLGAVLYEMLTGRPPFRGPTALDTLQQVLADEPAPPRRLQPKTPRDLETICLKCLQKDPKRRYDSALELAEDLRRFHTGEPITARPVGAAERAAKWARRRPAVAAFLALFVLSLLTGTAVSTTLAVVAYQANKATDVKNGLLNKANGELEGANSDLKETNAKRLAALRQASELALNQGIASSRDQEDVRGGMLWLAHALEIAPPEDEVLQHAIRRNLAAWRGAISPLKMAFPAPKFQVFHVAVSPDGRTVLSSGGDKAARLWDALTGEAVGAPLVHAKAIPRPADAPPQPEACIVNDAAFSPDGRLALTAGRFDDGKGGLAFGLRLWDAATGAPRSAVLEHPDAVLSAVFTPDGGAVLTTCADGAARLWDAPSGKARGEPMKLDAGIALAVFSPDGRLLLTCDNSGAARLWDAAAVKPVGEPMKQEAAVSAACFQGADAFLTAAGGKVRLWDAKGRLQREYTDFKGQILAFSPDGESALAADDNGLSLRSATGGTLEADRALSPRFAPQAYAFSPDGRILALATGDPMATQHEDVDLQWHGEVQLYAVDSGRLLGQPLRHTYPVRSLAFSADGRYLVSGTGLVAEHLNLVLDEKGNPVDEGHGAGVRLWEVAPGPTVILPLTPPTTPRFLGFVRDGGVLLTVEQNGEARQWDAVSGRPLGEPLKHPGVVAPPGDLGGDYTDVMAASFDDDGQNLTTCELHRRTEYPKAAPDLDNGDKGFPPPATERDEVRVWRWKGAEARSAPHPLRHEGDKIILCAAIRPDGRTIVTGGRDNAARLWDAETGDALGQPLAHDGPVSHVAFRPDGDVFLTVCDKTVRLWDTTTQAPLGRPLEAPGAVSGAGFSPDGRLLFTTTGKTIRLWSAADGTAAGPALVHAGPVFAVAFSPDGRTLLAGSSDGTTLWDMATGQPIGPTHPHGNGVSAVAFSPDGRTVAVAATLPSSLTGPAGLVELWELPSPLDGEPETVRLAAEVFAEQEQGKGGQIREMDVASWRERRRRLDEAAARSPALAAFVAGGDPADAEGQRRLGLGLMAFSHWRSAFSHFDRWAALRPGEVEPLRRRAKALLQMREYERSAADFARVLDREPGEWRDWFDCGYDRLQLAQYDKAAACYTKALELRPDEADLRKERAEALALAGRYAEALTDATKLLDATPDDYDLRISRGEMLAALGRTKEAVADWERALPIYGPARGWYCLALERLAADDAEGYRGVCSRAVKLYADAVPPVGEGEPLARACVLAPKGTDDFKRLKEFVQAGIDSPALWPKHAYRTTLGALLFREGEYEAAVEELEGIDRQAGETDAARAAFLAMACRRLGRDAEAEAWLDKARRAAAAKAAVPGAAWADRAEAKVLIREAERLPKTSPKPDQPEP